MAEVATPIVGPEENQLVPARLGGGTESMLDRWVSQDPDRAIARLETMVKMLEALRLSAIKQTYPSDWVIHTTTNQDAEITKQVGYLQDSGAERAGKVFGVEVGQPVIAHEDLPDGTRIYTMTADAWSKATGERIEHAMGSRWTGDAFFVRQLKDEDDKVDPTDVLKAAYANLHGRAVRSLSGLTAVPLDVLEAAGIKTSQCSFVGYGKGARGGQSAGATTGSADVTVAFGRSAGKKPAELEDRDLDWYLKAYGENVADEKKKQFQKANQRVLDALNVEKERRSRKAEHDAATGGPTGDPGESGAGDGKPTSRGTKLANLHTTLSDATKKNGQLLAASLRLMTAELFEKETSNLSDLTDEQLDKLSTWLADEKTLAAVIERAGKAGKK